MNSRPWIVKMTDHKTSSDQDDPNKNLKPKEFIWFGYSDNPPTRGQSRAAMVFGIIVGMLLTMWLLDKL